MVQTEHYYNQLIIFGIATLVSVGVATSIVFGGSGDSDNDDYDDDD